ncbi:MAG: T9SS type A sorting domain-containing protein [Flavobacteriales bacterium]|nr:T9SS type A sorting domain-containing protein [Flavobacteriales bacterium]
MLVANDSRSQQPLDLDTSFRTDILAKGVYDIMPLSDGRIFITGQIRFPGDPIGTFRSSAMLLQDGSRDLSFPTFPLTAGGQKITAWNGQYYVQHGNWVRRLDANCLIDNSFITETQEPHLTILQGYDHHIYPDGSVLISGTFWLNDTAHGHVGTDYCLVWLTNTGHLDSTKQHRACTMGLQRFEVLQNGQFLGWVDNQFTWVTWEGQVTGKVIRFDADGQLDNTFQTGFYWGTAVDFLPLPDGRVYVAGKFLHTGITDTLNLVRLLPDGSLDPTFNNVIDFSTMYPGIANAPPRSSLSSVQVFSPGELVVTGHFDHVDGEPRGGIALIDTSGSLLNGHFSCPGADVLLYQATLFHPVDYLHSVIGIKPSANGAFYLFGAYHGYDDGTTNDTLQRMVSRLHGLDVSVEEPLAVEDWKVKVWPNPAQDQLNVQLPQGLRGGVLRVLDATGRVVQEERFPAFVSSFSFPISALPPGLYTVQLMDQQAGRWLAKWIKE